MKHEPLPEGWLWVRFDDIAYNLVERNGDNPNRTVMAVTKYDGLVPSLEYFDRQVFSDDISKYKVVRPNQFAYAVIHLDEGSIGMNDTDEPILVSPVYVVFGLDERKADPEYFRFLLKSDYMMMTYQRIGEGTVDRRKSITFETLGSAHIPLPSKDEQRRIVEILRHADTNLAYVEAQIEAAQEVKRGVTQWLFTYGLAGEGATRKQTRIGDIPERWHLSEVGKEFDITSGFTFGPDRHPRQNKYKYLRVANVQREFIDLNVLAELEATPDEIAAKSLLEGDILAVEGHANPLEIGRCALVTRDAAGLTFQNHLFRLRSRTVEPRYAIAWLNSTWMGAYWEKHSRTSSGLHTINRSMLNEVPFPVPTTEEQCEIAAILSAHNATIHNLQAEAASLREVKRGLMQKLLSGEVRV